MMIHPDSAAYFHPQNQENYHPMDTEGKYTYFIIDEIFSKFSPSNFSVYHSGLLRVQGGPNKECETVRNIMAGISPAAFFLDMGSGMLAASSALASYYLCNYLATPIEERWVSIEVEIYSLFLLYYSEINFSDLLQWFKWYRRLQGTMEMLQKCYREHWMLCKIPLLFR